MGMAGDGGMRSTWSGTVVAESMDDDAMATDQAAREDQDKMTRLANKRARIYEVSWGRIGGVRGAANGDREVGVRGGIRFRIARPTNGCRWPLSLPSSARRDHCVAHFPCPTRPCYDLSSCACPWLASLQFSFFAPPHSFHAGCFRPCRCGAGGARRCTSTTSPWLVGRSIVVGG